VDNFSVFSSCVYIAKLYSTAMIQATIEEGRPAPAPRPQDPDQKLSPELKGMVPGQSVLLEKRASVALRAYGRYHGWKMVQKQEAGENGVAKVRVWRLE
jgi:hypothetical protein